MGTTEINRVSSVHVLENHTVELCFDDGFVGRIDLSPALWGPVFGPLQEPNFFRQVRIEDGTIRWPNDADFCPDVLRYWCEAGGVRNQEETDSYFAHSESTPAAS